MHASDVVPRRDFERLEAALRDAYKQQNATSEILRVISRSPTNVRPVFDTIVRSAVSLCGGLFANAFRFDGELLHFVATCNVEPGYEDLLKAKYPMRPDMSQVSGRVVLTRSIVRLEDALADLQYDQRFPAAMRWRRMLGVPMLRDGNPVGVIVVGWAEAGLVPKAQEELLKTFADQAAIAIENARLFDEVQKRNRDLSEALEQQTATSSILRVIAQSPTDIRPVLTAITESAAQLCDAYDATTFLREGDVLKVGAHHGPISVDFGDLPVGRDMVTGRSVIDRTPVHVHDLWDAGEEFAAGSALARRIGFRTILATPLLREGEAIGALMIRRFEVRPFSDKQIALLKTFADQAVIAIENARLFEEVQKRTAELSEALQQQTATADVLKAISRSAFNLQSILQTLVDSAIRLCGADKGAITLRKGDDLRFMAGAGQSPELRAYEEANPHKLGRGTFQGRAAIEGTTIHVPDVLADPEYERKETAIFGVRAVLSVPLKRGTNVIGVFGLARATVGPFAPRQIELVESFADQAVIAIENARLFEEVQARTAELAEALQQQTATADVLKVISRSAFNIQSVLDTLAESAARLCEADIVDFYRLVENDFHWAATFGPDADRQHTTILRRPGRGSVSGRVLLERKTVHVPDFEADAEFTFVDVARRRGIRAILGVPLLRGDMLIGLLLVMRKLPGPFSTKQIELAETFADQAVIAIENARLFEEVQARNRDLTESLERQTAMSDILRVISRSPTDVQPVFETIVESAARLCNARFCSVFRFDGELIHFVAQHGWPTEAIDAQRRPFPMRPGRGSGASRAILSGAVEQIPDVTTDPDYQLGETARAINARSVLAVPMLRDGRPVGSINIGRLETGHFPARQIELLQTFADQAVIAIENVRLFEEVQARNRELSEALEQQTATAAILGAIAASPTDIQPVLKAVAKSAAQLCDAYDAAIFLRDGDSLRIGAHHGPIPIDFKIWPIGRDWVTGRAVAERRTVHVHDLIAAGDEYPAGMAMSRRLGHRTILSTPLLREGEAIGALIIRRTEVRPFTEKQIELLQTFANQAAIAIENVRLFDEVQARTREVTESLEQQTAASEILKVIARSPTDVQPVFDTIATSAAHLCGTGYCIVFGFDGELVHFVAEHGLPPEIVARNREVYPMPPGRGSAAARAILSRTVEQIPDVEADSDFAHASITRRAQVRSLIAVPMLKDDAPAGAIVVARPQVGLFPEREIDLLKTFADQAVIAIQNVRLFEEVQARTAELSEALEQQTATSEVLRVIASSPTALEPVLQAVAESAARLCDAYDSLLLLREGQRLVLGAHYGPVPFDFPNWPLERDWVAGRSVIDRETIHVPDLSTAGDEFATGREMSIRLGHRTVAAAPLKREGEAIGTIVLRRAEVRPFTAKQIELLRTFADQAVIAIENVRLFDEVQAKSRDLEEALTFQKAAGDVLEVIGRSASTLEPVLEAIVDTAADLCRADMSVVRLLRDGALHYAAASKRNDPAIVSHSQEHPIMPTDRSSVAGRVALEGRTIHIADISVDPEYSYLGRFIGTEIHSILGVPLFQDGQVIGVIALLRKAVDPFTERQIELVQTFADQAVIAIENVRLFEEVQARTEELTEALRQQTATAEVLKAISRSTFDLQTVLNTLVESAAKLCGANVAQIFRWDGAVLNWVAGFALNQEYLAIQMGRAYAAGRASLVGRVAAEKRTVLVSDALADPEYAYKEHAAVGQIRTMLGVPLLRGGEFIGALAVARDHVEDFTEKQIELVQTFADQAVIAIENVRLFEEVKQRTEELSRSLEDLRTAQDRLVQTEKLASLGQLTAGIAHEIKNPLNFVNNFSALSGELVGELRDALGAAPLDEKLRAEITELTSMLEGNLDKVMQHGRRADSIVKNMLLHSRQGSGEHRLADINAIVEESLNLAYHGARAERQGFTITLEKSLDPQAGQVDLFPQEITRVLLNLISNGFYATAKRSAAANSAYEPTLSASTRNLGDSVEIRIRDNGTGIPAAVKEKMFNPFFTTKPPGEGTGLGLSLSHDIIVKQHAGRIEVDTGLGEFTEFRIVLPRGAASVGKSMGHA